MSILARSSKRRRGRRLLGASPPARSRSLGSGCGPPAESAPCTRGPGSGHCACSGILERPAPGLAPSLPAPRLLLGAAFRLVAPESGGAEAGLEPCSPGGGDRAPKRAGMRQGGARLRGRAWCAGLEPGVCRLGFWRRALVAARTRAGADKAMRCSGHHAALPRTPGRVGDAAKLPSPSSPFPCRQTTAPGGLRWSHP